VERIHGRIFAAWRFEQDPAGEAALASPLASFRKFAFAPFVHKGRAMARGDPSIQFFDRAENPLGMPGSVRAMLAARGVEFDFSRYPDAQCSLLRANLAERLRLPPENFTFGPGSAELVERVVRTSADAVRGHLNDATWFMFDRFCAVAEIVPRKVDVIQHEPHVRLRPESCGVARSGTAHPLHLSVNRAMLGSSVPDPSSPRSCRQSRPPCRSLWTRPTSSSARIPTRCTSWFVRETDGC
jgi:hypothetical protein